MTDNMWQRSFHLFSSFKDVIFCAVKYLIYWLITLSLWRTDFMLLGDDLFNFVMQYFIVLLMFQCEVNFATYSTLATLKWQYLPFLKKTVTNKCLTIHLAGWIRFLEIHFFYKHNSGCHKQEVGLWTPPTVSLSLLVFLASISIISGTKPYGFRRQKFPAWLLHVLPHVNQDSPSGMLSK